MGTKEWNGIVEPSDRVIGILSRQARLLRLGKLRDLVLRHLEQARRTGSALILAKMTTGRMCAFHDALNAIGAYKLDIRLLQQLLCLASELQFTMQTQLLP